MDFDEFIEELRRIGEIEIKEKQIQDEISTFAKTIGSTYKELMAQELPEELVLKIMSVLIEKSFK